MKLRRTSGVVAVVALTFGIPFLWAQNLGDVAREDRERRSRLSSHSPVLTNDDLARERILTPELKNRILRTQAGVGAVDPQNVTALAPAAEGPLPPVTLEMIQQIRSSAVHQALAIEAVEPAAVAAQTLAARAPSYTEPAVAVNVAVDEPVSLGEYARQMRASRVAHLSVQPLDAGTAEIAVATHEQGISLGEFARELRASRVAQLDLQAPEIAAAESPLATREEEISLGEYARQLQLRFPAEPLIVRSPAADEIAPDAGQPVSLGDYARQLRAVRAVPAYESASITPLPPRAEVKAVEPEISLGEYARQLRMRQSAEEYMRLLAQDDASIAAALPREALAPIRFHEIRSSAPAPSRRAQRAVAAAPGEDSTPDAPGHIAVTIRRGDSLWKLARIYMGSGARWQSISFLTNHAGSPDLIHAGEVVLIPMLDPQRRQGPVVASRFPGRRLR